MTPLVPVLAHHYPYSRVDMHRQKVFSGRGHNGRAQGPAGQGQTGLQQGVPGHTKIRFRLFFCYGITLQLNHTYRKLGTNRR